MTRRTYYETLLKVGGLWNILAALAFVALRGPALDFLGMEAPRYTAFYNGFFVAVLLFGIGYFQVGRDPSQNRAIVALGAVGKIAVFVLFLTGWRSGELPGLVALAGTVDLVFALLFFEFLAHHARKGREPSSSPTPSLRRDSAGQ